MLESHYLYPSVGVGGLANRIFPWARAQLAADQHRLPLIAPQWVQAKIGPLLRRERDPRFYSGVFSSAPYIHGPKRLLLLAGAPRLPEAVLKSPEPLPRGRRPRVIVFDGLTDFFGPLCASRERVIEQLFALIRPAIHRSVEAESRGLELAIHVRRGDMPVVKHGERLHLGINKTLPIDWYIHSLNQARATFGTGLSATVFSDGTDAELSQLLAQPNVRRARPNPAIVDLLLLGRSCGLITTGTSTFSAMGYFLGKMPSIWYPGTREGLNLQIGGTMLETDGESALVDVSNDDEPSPVSGKTRRKDAPLRPAADAAP